MQRAETLVDKAKNQVRLAEARLATAEAKRDYTRHRKNECAIREDEANTRARKTIKWHGVSADKKRQAAAAARRKMLQTLDRHSLRKRR